MTEIFRFLFFTKISSYFLEESDRNFGGVLIKGGFLFLIALYKAIKNKNPPLIRTGNKIGIWNLNNKAKNIEIGFINFKNKKKLKFAEIL